MDDADEDGSGNINFQEFVGLMLKRQEGGMTREEIKQVSDWNVYYNWEIVIPVLFFIFFSKNT